MPHRKITTYTYTRHWIKTMWGRQSRWALGQVEAQAGMGSVGREVEGSVCPAFKEGRSRV